MGSRVQIRLFHILHFVRDLLFPLLKNSKPGVDDRGHRFRSGSPLTNYPHAAPRAFFFMIPFKSQFDAGCSHSQHSTENKASHANKLGNGHMLPLSSELGAVMERRQIFLWNSAVKGGKGLPTFL